MTSPELPEIDGWIPALEREQLDPDEVALRRAIADVAFMWRRCPRPACHRAYACRSRTVACFDEQRPAVVRVMRKFVYEGYVNEDEDEDEAAF